MTPTMTPMRVGLRLLCAPMPAPLADRAWLDDDEGAGVAEPTTGKSPPTPWYELEGATVGSGVLVGAGVGAFWTTGVGAFWTTGARVAGPL